MRSNLSERQKTRAGAGFTLVELLVVIAIIALLLAVGGPSTRKAIHMAQGNSCFYNVRALSTGWVTYATENNLWLVGGYTSEYLTHNPPLLWPWAYYGNENPGNTGRNLLITNGKLYPYVDRINAYKCPSDPLAHIRSYSLTSMMNGQDWGGGNPPIPYIVKYNEIREAGACLTFVDEKDPRSISNMGTFAQDRRDWNTNRWVDFVANFHGDGDNFGFADGHSEYWKWEDKRTLDISAAQTFYGPDNGNPDLLRIRRAFFDGIAGAY